MKRLLVPLVLLLAVPLLAQESASFQLTEHTLNSGGNPTDGVVLASTSFMITLDAIGDPVAGSAMSSASFEMDGGFVRSYPPPGEVRNLEFHKNLGDILLGWDPERSAGDYVVYSGPLEALPDADYGFCIDEVVEPPVEPPGFTICGSCEFYLVSARNRLLEEGTLGSDSSDIERPTPDPCP